ncbi:MAG: hypothetical protein OXB84_05670 [Halobacteriovoraceae bacterium]|nr:hypothetical protein [Halobacteriovoraceae bacterium]
MTGKLQNFVCSGKRIVQAAARGIDGSVMFFFKHYGKSRFMVAMSKKAQVLGIERLWQAGRKAFVYFFIFYLIRDTILYIIIPIYIARLTTD